MPLTGDLKAISTLSLIIALLTSAIIGALLSYMWVLGYYEGLKISNPDIPTVAITNASFSNQNTDLFEVTLLNPTYSTSDQPIKIIGFRVSTKDGLIHNVTEATPSTPILLEKGNSTTVKCSWNWADYTGETISITALTAEETSGATLQKRTPLVKLLITEVDLDPTVSVTHFNITLQNSNLSDTYVNVTEIILTSGNTSLPLGALTTPALPYTLHPNDTAELRCNWNWTQYQNLTIVAYTAQGYHSEPLRATAPGPTVLGITEVIFNLSDTSHFKATVRNFQASPPSSYVNITDFNLIMENGTLKKIDEVQPGLSPPPALYPNDTGAFTCSWNWTNYLGRYLTVSVSTLQNSTASYRTATPPPVTITDVAFSLDHTDSFNVTVKNSEFSPTSINVTDVIVTLQNGTVKEINGTLIHPPLTPYLLDSGKNQTFVCPWNWKHHQGRNITVTVRTLENYTAHHRQMTPVNLTLKITDTAFDPSDKSYFEVTIKNTENSSVAANITKITVSVDDKTVEMKELIPHLPKMLEVDSSVTFRCSWAWAGYQGEQVRILVETSQGYRISREVEI